MIRHLATILALAWPAASLREPPAPHPAIIDHRPAILNRLAKGIARHEKCPMNNPGCLVYSSQRGATRHWTGFAAFSTPQAGTAALKADIAAKLKRGMTVAEIVTKYDAAYLEDLLRETGLSGGDSWR